MYCFQIYPREKPSEDAHSSKIIIKVLKFLYSLISLRELFRKYDFICISSNFNIRKPLRVILTGFSYPSTWDVILELLQSVTEH